jgi:hypothetical protein
MEQQAQLNVRLFVHTWLDHARQIVATQRAGAREAPPFGADDEPTPSPPAPARPSSPSQPMTSAQGATLPARRSRRRLVRGRPDTQST